MITLVTYSNDLMSIAAELCKTSASKNNVDKISHWKREDIIKTKFYEDNKVILDNPRGDGLWCWKAFIILEELKKAKEEEIIIYSDAGVEIINNVNYIIDKMDSDIWVFGNMYQHAHWCKRDIIEAISPEKTWEDFDKQVQASVIIFKVNQKTIQFVKDWLKFCENEELIDDSPSKAPNHPEFRENRHDQAILTTLCYRDGIKLHWWPASYNNGSFNYPQGSYEDVYPVIFNHNRKRNNEF